MQDHTIDGTAARDLASVPPPRESGTRAKALGGPVDAPVAAELLRGAMVSTGVSQEALAARLGVSRALVRKWLLGLGGPALRLVQMRRRCPTLLADLMARLASPNAAKPGLCLRQHALLAAERSGELCGAVRRALADGALDDRERRELRRLVGQQIACLRRMDLDLAE